MLTANPTQSYISICWKLWFVLTALLLLIRFTTFFDTQNEDTTFNLFIFYAVPIWGAVMLLNLILGSRLKCYLKNTHYNKYLDVFSFQGRNGFAPLRFVYSKDDLGDATLGNLKKEYRSFIKLTLSIFFTLPLLFVIVMAPVAQLIESLFY
jgi:hypothetical protein